MCSFNEYSCTLSQINVIFASLSSSSTILHESECVQLQNLQLPTERFTILNPPNRRSVISCTLVERRIFRLWNSEMFSRGATNNGGIVLTVLTRQIDPNKHTYRQGNSRLLLAIQASGNFADLILQLDLGICHWVAPNANNALCHWVMCFDQQWWITYSHEPTMTQCRIYDKPVPWSILQSQNICISSYNLLKWADSRALLGRMLKVYWS